MKSLILKTFSLVLAVVPGGATQATLPKGCNADNPVRAIQNHASQGAADFCSSIVPDTYTTLVATTTTTVYGGYTTVTTTMPYRSTYFDNAKSYVYPETPSPITYTNNQPSGYTHYPTPLSTPSYLTSYEFWRLYTACTCVYPRPTGPTKVAPWSLSTYNVKPTGTYTQTSTGPTVPVAVETFAAACNPSIIASYLHFYTGVSVSRAYATVSPLPYVNTRGECCQRCSNTFNCLWWQHSANGLCNYAWAVDTKPQLNEYRQCPNGGASNDVQFLGVADKNQPDSYGVGACAVDTYGIAGENQSGGDSMEIELHFQEMCRYYGGQYCSVTNFHV